MKRILTLLLCLHSTSTLPAQEKSAQKQEEHTHTIEIKFKVNVTPNSPDDWKELEKLFTQFVETAKNAQTNKSSLPKLLSELKSAFDKVPGVCESRNMPGNINTSLKHYGDIAPELIPIKTDEPLI